MPSSGKYVNHPLYRTPTHNTWIRIRTRCNNPNNPSYHYYTDISYDPRWNDFREFCEDMGKRPEDKPCLCRYDTNKDYNKENCFWGTMKEVNRHSNNAVLSNKKVANLKVLNTQGVSAKSLAEELLIGETTVRYALAGRTWY